MIRKTDLVKIGKTAKAHGIRGEVTFHFTNDSFLDSETTPEERAKNDPAFLIFELDGIFVPFRLEEVRLKTGSSAFVKFKNVDSESQAARLVNREVWFPKDRFREEEELEDGAFTWNHLIGYALTDEKYGMVGRITGIDDSTLNTLFEVEGKSGMIVIPASEEWITHIGEERKELFVLLPEGLLDL